MRAVYEAVIAILGLIGIGYLFYLAPPIGIGLLILAVLIYIAVYGLRQDRAQKHETGYYR